MTACPTPEKAAHASRPAAVRALQHAVEFFGKGAAGDVYRCVCESWHVTSARHATANKRRYGARVEIDPDSLRVFMGRHGLTPSKLASLAGVHPRRLRDGLFHGAMNAEDVGALQAAMAEIVGEARERMRRAGVG